MRITTQTRKATRNVGTRVVATSNEGHRAVEFYDYNTSERVNHERAAQLVSRDAEFIAFGPDRAYWRA